MNEKKENMNVEETEENIVEMRRESKVRSFMKKNGKKIAAGVAIVAGVGMVYVLGKNSIKAIPSVDVSDAIDDVSDAAMTFTEV